MILTFCTAPNGPNNCQRILSSVSGAKLYTNIHQPTEVRSERNLSSMPLVIESKGLTDQWMTEEWLRLLQQADKKRLLPRRSQPVIMESIYWKQTSKSFSELFSKRTEKQSSTHRYLDRSCVSLCRRRWMKSISQKSNEKRNDSPKISDEKKKKKDRAAYLYLFIDGRIDGIVVRIGDWEVAIPGR